MKHLCLFLAIVSQTLAVEWNGYERFDFTVNDKQIWLIKPKQAAPGNPWIWRAEFFGHEPQGDLALLAKGFHVAYTNMQNQYGAPIAIEHMATFHDAMFKDHALSAKVVLEGFSQTPSHPVPAPRPGPTRPSPPITNFLADKHSP